MPKDDSVVKSFRTAEAQFNAANEIFKKEGFSFSEVIRLLLEATVREGRIPRALSTKTMEEMSDKAVYRENYIDRILDMAIPNPRYNSMSAEQKVLRCIFGEAESSKDMTNASLREWGDKWGLPEEFSIATLADIHDSGFFPEDPWCGDYNYSIDGIGDGLEDTAVIFKFRDNLKDNLDKIRHKMEVKAVKVLMEYDKKEEQ